MGNTCDIIITKGNNKGRMCRDVHRWCKHKKIACSDCKRTFQYQHSYDTHQCLRQPKIKVSVKRKSADDDLKQLVTKLQGEIEEMKNRPSVQINNLTVVTDDLFSKIVESMGQQAGVQFLMDSLNNGAAGSQHCFNIVDKVYLNIEDRDKYPIACKDQNHFRFLGPNYKVVDDVGGELIVKKLTTSVQNAMLQASSKMIEGHVLGDNTEKLCTMYDMRSLQSRISDMPSEESNEQFRRELAYKVTNPSHPFFKDP